MRLLASPLPEARDIGQMALRELQADDPELPHPRRAAERGGRWVALPRGARARGRARGRAPGPRPAAGGDRPRARGRALLSFRGTEEDLLAALLFESAAASEEETRAAIAS